MVKSNVLQHSRDLRLKVCEEERIPRAGDAIIDQFASFGLNISSKSKHKTWCPTTFKLPAKYTSTPVKRFSPGTDGSEPKFSCGSNYEQRKRMVKSRWREEL